MPEGRDAGGTDWGGGFEDFGFGFEDKFTVRDRWKPSDAFYYDDYPAQLVTPPIIPPESSKYQRLMNTIARYRPEFRTGIFNLGPIQPLSDIGRDRPGLLGQTQPTGTWDMNSPLYIKDQLMREYSPDFGPLDVIRGSVPPSLKQGMMENVTKHEGTHNILASPLFSDIAGGGKEGKPSYLSEAIGNIYNPGPRPALKKAFENIIYKGSREPGPQEKYDVAETRPSPLEQKAMLDHVAEHNRRHTIEEVFNRFLDLDTPSQGEQERAAQWIENSRIFPSRPSRQLTSILDVGARDPSELHKSGRIPVTVDPKGFPSLLQQEQGADFFAGEPLSPPDPRTTGIMAALQQAKDMYRDRLERFKDVGLKPGEDPLYTVPFNKNIPMNLFGRRPVGGIF